MGKYAEAKRFGRRFDYQLNIFIHSIITQDSKIVDEVKDNGPFTDERLGNNDLASDTLALEKLSADEDKKSRKITYSTSSHDLDEMHVNSFDDLQKRLENTDMDLCKK